MLKFFAPMFTAVVLFTACTGGEGAKEPVTPDDSAPPIPDIPGQSGESAEKPAGEGEAGEVAEKSQPNVGGAQGVSGGTHTVNSGALNVRSGPGMKFDVVKVLQKGTTVTLSECGPVWCKIGEGEYVSKKFVQQ